MQFHNPDKNNNVEAPRDQTQKTLFLKSFKRGAEKFNSPLKQGKPSTAPIQTNTTFLKKRSSQPPLQLGRDNSRANTTQDFDWYGNSN